MSMHPTAMLLALAGCIPMQFSGGKRGQRMTVLSPDRRFVLHRTSGASGRMRSAWQIVADSNDEWTISENEGIFLKLLSEWDWDEWKDYTDSGTDWSSLSPEFVQQFIDLFGE